MGLSVRLTVFEGPLDLLLYLIEKNKIEKKYQYADSVMAPVERGAEVGYISYSLEGRELGRMPIVASEPVEKAFFIDYLKRMLIRYLI